MNDKAVAEKLQFLAEVTGKGEDEILADAVRAGVDTLYRRHTANQLRRSRISRHEAAHTLTEEQIAAVETERDLIVQDIRDGMTGG